MQDYGVRESWTKLFTTTQEPIIHYPFWMPILSLKTGDILMHSYDGFVLCDPKNGRVGKVSSFFQENKRIVRVLTMITAHPESYVESLVSLNSGTYVKKPRRQKSRVKSPEVCMLVDKTAFEIVSFTSWYIWKSRCAKLFDNVRVNESGTIAIILSEVRDWKLSTKSVANNLNDTVPTIPK
ncbi:hypothetical protein C5167_004625 [Papaver somniferum]|uniref:Uncharacterized protein n=1 Tax=Papaver somniferum TaxID=3469 RepID=A0A4Y7JBN1_PAPSO|nr:hypothetical protein C5167_004625 [Papaver somniferum]